MKLQVRGKINVDSIYGSKLVWFNLGLLGIACLFLAYYIVTANHLAALNYQIQNIEVRLTGLAEENAALASEKFRIDEPSYLANFAKGIGMVEVSSPNHIFSGSGVALGR